MYIPINCKSCGQPVGHLFKIYKELILKYSSKHSDKYSPEYLALKELIEKHNFDPSRYCCRITMICTYDATDIID